MFGRAAMQEALARGRGALPPTVCRNGGGGEARRHHRARDREPDLERVAGPRRRQAPPPA